MQSACARRCALTLLSVAAFSTVLAAYTLIPSPPGITLKWNTKTIPYYINPEGSGLSIDQLKPAIQSAFDAWTPYTGITFQYISTTTAKNAIDSQNVIFWDTAGSFVPTRALARTRPIADDTGRIYGADIGFSVGPYAKGSGILVPPRKSGCPGLALAFGGVPLVWTIGQQGVGGDRFKSPVYYADVQATATHEIGHLLGLDHSLVQNAVMSTMDSAGATPSFFCSTDQRNLKNDDIQGAMFLYKNQPPTAGFLMTSAGQMATDGGTLNVQVFLGGQATVKFDALGSPPRSFDPDGDPIIFEWHINGSVVSSAPSFTRGLVAGIYSVTLTVSDDRGGRSPRAEGRVVVTELPPVNQPPTAGFTMSVPGQIATEGGTLNLAVAPGGTINVTLDALGSPPRSSDPDGSIAAFEWTRNGTRFPTATFTGSLFVFGFGVGTHIVSLVVVDNQAARSTPVQGTIVVSDSGLYSLTDLGTLGDSYTTASAINAVGQVAGGSNAVSSTGAVIGHPFLWTAGVMQDLDPTSTGTSGANALNRFGHVVGGGFSGSVLRPILWNNGGRTDLGTLPGDVNGIAFGINDTDRVAGYSYNFITFSSGTFTVGQAFVWTSATGLQPLSPLPGQNPAHTITAAYGINNSGQIAGESAWQGVGAGSQAVLWTGGVPQALGILPTLTDSTAYAVNESGQVVGVSWATRCCTTVERRAFLWNGGSLTDLGVLPKTNYVNSVAYAINNSGQAVGHSDGFFVPRHAVLFSGGTVRDLNDLIPANSGWDRLEEAHGINDAGQIVGWGVKNGQTRAFLLNP